MDWEQRPGVGATLSSSSRRVRSIKVARRAEWYGIDCSVKGDRAGVGFDACAAACPGGLTCLISKVNMAARDFCKDRQVGIGSMRTRNKSRRCNAHAAG